MNPDDLQKSIVGLADELERIAKRKLGRPEYRVYSSLMGIVRVAWRCRSLWITKTSASYSDLKQDLRDFRKSLHCRTSGHVLKAGKVFDRCTECNQWFKRP